MIDISVTGLVKEFEVGKKILDGLSFQVDTGERVGLLGPNGCGKTTFLRILTGEVRPDEGDVAVAPDKRLGLISQIPVYPAGYSVEDVLDTAFEPLHRMEEEMSDLSRRMAEGEEKLAAAGIAVQKHVIAPEEFPNHVPVAPGQVVFLLEPAADMGEVPAAHAGQGLLLFPGVFPFCRTHSRPSSFRWPS